MSIGRNDPCPCGSGKKYKKCCKAKDEIMAELPSATFPETEILDKLLKESAEFRVFYESERGKISKPLYWVQDATLPEGIDFSASRHPRGYSMIHLREVPIATVDAASIAHELFHLILDTEGFPLLKARTHDWAQTATALASCPHDLLLDQRLISFGINIYEKYKRERDSTFIQLENRNDGPRDQIEELLWTVNYADHILHWELFCRPYEESDNFQLLFDEKNPEIASRGQELIRIIRETGYETPDKMTLLFKRAISFLGLRREIEMSIP